MQSEAGPKALVLEYSGLFESKAKKARVAGGDDSPRGHRARRAGRLGRSTTEWCRIVLRGAGAPPSLADDPLAFETWPQLTPFLDRLEAAVERGPVDPPVVPWPVRSATDPEKQVPMERGRTTSALGWMFGE